MNAHDFLGDDGQVLLALCSAFALPPDSEARGLTPFKLAEWNQLSVKIGSSSFQRPNAIHGQSSESLSRTLGITSDEADRISRLLNRSSRLAIELETLFGRGMWAVTRVDAAYPARLKNRLKHQAPTVLFGAGDIQLLGKEGVAIVGSRNIDETGAIFAKEIGRKAVRAEMTVVSGGARGTDRIAMDGAMESGGTAIGAIADSLEATVKKTDVRQLLLEGRLTLTTPYAPTAGFSVGAAMGRNKLIYGLSDYAVVVSSELETGGTWSGAVEALKAKWCPVFVRADAGTSNGNAELIKRGGSPLTSEDLIAIPELKSWLKEHAIHSPREQDLFA